MSGAHGTNNFTASQAEEIFRQFFGGNFDSYDPAFSDSNGFTSGDVNQIVLKLSFDEAVHGCSKDISLRVQGICERCSGSGGEPGTKEQTCPYCKGRGEVSHILSSFIGGRDFPFFCSFLTFGGSTVYSQESGHSLLSLFRPHPV